MYNRPLNFFTIFLKYCCNVVWTILQIHVYTILLQHCIAMCNIATLLQYCCKPVCCMGCDIRYNKAQLQYYHSNETFDLAIVLLILSHVLSPVCKFLTTRCIALFRCLIIESYSKSSKTHRSVGFLRLCNHRKFVVYKIIVRPTSPDT